MQQRIDAMKVSPAAYKAMAGLQAYVDQSGLERSLLELVKIRASQINGCAFCLVMHTNEARKLGETDDRMHLLNAWREAPVFSERERAALAWVEAVTLVADGHVPDDVYDAGRASNSPRRNWSISRLRSSPSTAGTALSIAYHGPQPQVEDRQGRRLSRSADPLQSLGVLLPALDVDVGAARDHRSRPSRRACGSRAPARRRSANCRESSCPR